MGFWEFMGGSTPAGIVSSAAKEVTDSTFKGIGDLIKIWKLPPEAELAFHQFMSEQQLKAAEVNSKGTDSARQMQAITRSRMPALLTVFYTVAFVIVSAGLLYMAFYKPDLQMSNFQAGLVGSIWGALAKEAAYCSSFYVGTTSGSDEKNATIANLSGQANEKRLGAS